MLSVFWPSSQNAFKDLITCHLILLSGRGSNVFPPFGGNVSLLDITVWSRTIWCKFSLWSSIYTWFTSVLLPMIDDSQCHLSLLFRQTPRKYKWMAIQMNGNSLNFWWVQVAKGHEGSTAITVSTSVNYVLITTRALKPSFQWHQLSHHKNFSVAMMLCNWHNSKIILIIT